MRSSALWAAESFSATRRGMLAGSNGQNYLVDVFDPLLSLVEPAVLSALHL
jgi:hypothetical protein